MSRIEDDEGSLIPTRKIDAQEEDEAEEEVKVMDGEPRGDADDGGEQMGSVVNDQLVFHTVLEVIVP